jgi:hypothetical protein
MDPFRSRGAHHRHARLWRPTLIGLAATGVLTLLGACSGPDGGPVEPIPAVDHLPTGRDVLVDPAFVATDTHRAPAFYLVDPGNGALSRWDLVGDGVLGTTEISCLAGVAEAEWVPARQRLFATMPAPCPPGAYWLTPTGAMERAVLPDAVVPTPGAIRGHAWSPDAQTLAFIRPHPVAGVPAEGVTGIKTEDVAVLPLGSDEALLLSALPTGEIRSLTWQRDGRAILVAHYQPDVDTASLLKVDTWTGQATDVFDPAIQLPFTTDAGAFAGPLAVSPDGHRLAFLVAGALWLLDLGDAVAQSAAVPTPELGHQGVTRFAWSPDGTRLALASDHEGECLDSSDPAVVDRCSSFLYVYDVAKQRLDRLTTVPQSAPSALVWITRD